MACDCWGLGKVAAKHSGYVKGKLGLSKGQVRLVAHQGQWKSMYEAEKRSLLRVAAKQITNIEHVGSTSIPGLPAKPIIDILMIVRKTQHPLSLLRSLARANYRLSSNQPFAEHRVFVKGRPVTHIIHCVKFGDPTIDRLVNFRDCLRADRKMAGDYVTLKRRLSRMHKRDRKKYADAKNDFIGRAITERREKV